MAKRPALNLQHLKMGIKGAGHFRGIMRKIKLRSANSEFIFNIVEGQENGKWFLETEAEDLELIDSTPERNHIDAFNRVTSNSDMWLKIAGLASAKELEQFLDGTMSVYVILSFEFERRFPKEAKIYNDRQNKENGE